MPGALRLYPQQVFSAALGPQHSCVVFQFSCSSQLAGRGAVIGADEIGEEPTEEERAYQMSRIMGRDRGSVLGDAFHQAADFGLRTF
ncbi:hypothetical protein ABVB72_18330 [Rhizobium nepotum]|uniref:hypothetical protein n=1 Tax=Rhizobium nepotum TaxID=1035271 RepID=UPI00336AC4AE